MPSPIQSKSPQRLKSKVMQLFLALTLLLITHSCTAQNPHVYQSETHALTIKAIDGIWLSARSNTFPRDNGYTKNYPQHDTTLSSIINEISAVYNNRGFQLVAVNLVSPPTYNGSSLQGVANLLLTYEKSDSFREKELYKLIDELTTRIDSVAGRTTDKAMLQIRTEVLNYLKSIPTSVIAEEYKDNLTRTIMLNSEQQFRALAEELRTEIRKSSIKP